MLNPIPAFADMEYNDLGPYEQYKNDITTMVGDSLPGPDWSGSFFRPNAPISRTDFVEAMASAVDSYLTSNNHFPNTVPYVNQVYRACKGLLWADRTWFDDKNQTVMNPNGRVSWNDAATFVINMLPNVGSHYKIPQGRNALDTLEKARLNERIPNWGKSTVVTRLDTAILAENILYWEHGKLFPPGSRLVFVGQTSLQVDSIETPKLEVVDKYGHWMADAAPYEIEAPYVSNLPIGKGTLSPDVEVSNPAGTDLQDDAYQFLQTGTFTFTGAYADMQAPPLRVAVGLPNITHIARDTVPSPPTANHLVRDDQLGLPTWDKTLVYLSDIEDPDPDDLKAESNVISVNRAVYIASDNAPYEDPTPTWLVDSPDATITPGPVLSNGASISATFIAHAPGIYAVTTGAGSPFQPTYLDVAVSKLPYIPYQAPVVPTGILPLPANLPKVKPETKRQMEFTPYKGLTSSFVPVSGVAPKRTHFVTVMLGGSATPSTTWSYRLPVDKTGHFGALLYTQTGGASVPVTIRLDGVTSSGSSSGNSVTTYDTSMYAKPLADQQKALLASDRVDFNLYPNMAKIAGRILENSDATDTAIRAIVAYVNHTSGYYLAKSIPHFDQSPAEVTAAYLRSVGIPVQVNVPDTKVPSQEWLEVWNGDVWTPVYPAMTGVNWVKFGSESPAPSFKIGQE